MYRKRDMEISHLKRLLGEIVPYIFKSIRPLKSWTYGKDRVSPPFRWEGLRTVFETTLEINPEIENPYLKAWFGGETLVKVDDVPYGEINEYHRVLNLRWLKDGKPHNLRAEVVSRGLFGTPEEPIFKEAFLVDVDRDMRYLVNFVESVIDLAGRTENDALSKALIDLTDEFLSSVNVPRSTDSYLKSAQYDPTISNEISRTWSKPDFPDVSGFDSSPFREELFRKFQDYRAKIEKLNERFGKLPTEMTLVGHSHIDYTWLWPMEETLNKILRTFSNVVLLAREYPFFKFSQSSAQMYENVKELSPELFQRIKELVEEGRWEPVGGMWVESDCTIPSMESLIRQFYYGQKFFEREFGRKSSVCWLPDIFGFSWILPQILKEAGMELFVTTKLNWNESNEFPYDLCIWRGIDGSEVVYHSFRNPVQGYNARIVAEALIKTHDNFRQKDLTPHVLLSFGYVDGGGGPTEEMCERYSAFKELPGVPNIHMGTMEGFKESLMESIEGKELPKWDGPLYLELHRGTYTSQSRTKALHKEMEERLRNAEMINAFLNSNRQDEIDRSWKILLRNENHDLLPGSSIREVHEEAEREFKKESKKLERISEEIFNDGPREAGYITVFNPSSFQRKLYIELEEPLKLSLNGEDLVFQPTHDGKFVYTSDQLLDPLSFTSLEVTGRYENFKKSSGESTSMENEYLEVEILEDGTARIRHKKTGREVFKGSGNILKFYKNIPAHWDNWDIDVNYEKAGRKLKASSIKMLERGPVRGVVGVEYEIEGSKISQYYILKRGFPYLEIKTVLDWHSRRSMLKAIFPMNVLTRWARLDIDGGYLEVPTHRNTNFEKARFEVPHHRWFDLSQHDFGVSVLNESKYGSGFHESTAGLTLLKAGVFPDFFCDEGHHEFSYAIYPHEGDDIESTIELAENFSRKPVLFEGKREIVSRIGISGGTFRVLSFRKTDVYVLRIVELLGSSGRAIVELNGLNVKRVYKTDILEESKVEIPFEDDRFEFEYSPFKVYTFLLI